jgi:hypothetical protein
LNNFLPHARSKFSKEGRKRAQKNVILAIGNYTNNSLWNFSISFPLLENRLLELLTDIAYPPPKKTIMRAEKRKKKFS